MEPFSNQSIRDDKFSLEMLGHALLTISRPRPTDPHTLTHTDMIVTPKLNEKRNVCIKISKKISRIYQKHIKTYQKYENISKI